MFVKKTENAKNRTVVIIGLSYLFIMRNSRTNPIIEKRYRENGGKLKEKNDEAIIVKRRICNFLLVEIFFIVLFIL